MKETSIYEAGMIPQGSRVVVVVSQGPFPGTIAKYATVPDVVDKSQGAALESLVKEGLQSHVVYDYHPMARKGSVMAQLPEPGASMPYGSKTTVLVSSGEPLRERLAVDLPNVVGMDESQAVTTLNQVGLAPQVRYEYDATVPAGIVIAQLPDQLTYVDKAINSTKRTVLWVVLGLIAIALLLVAAYFLMNSMAQTKATYLVPDVTGMTTVDATREILKAGLAVGTVKEVTVTDGSAKDGTVIKTDPLANTEVPTDTKVNLEVANTETDKGQNSSTDSTLKAAVPNVVGTTQDSAVAVLESAGFTALIQEKSDEGVAKGKVIEQTPKGGLSMPKGAQVMILVSSGPATKMVDVPDVVGLSESAARSTIMAAGLEMTKSEGSSDSVAAGNVISQVPSAGKSVTAGSNITVVVSTGPEAGSTPAN